MERITVRIEKDTLDKLDDRAEIENRTRSEVIRQILADHSGSDIPHRVDDLEERVAKLESEQSRSISSLIAGFAGGFLLGDERDELSKPDDADHSLSNRLDDSTKDEITVQTEESDDTPDP